MHMQVMIYPVMDRWQVTVSKHAASETGYEWSQLLSDLVQIPSYCSDDPWDVLWTACQHIQEFAIRAAGDESRHKSPPS